MNQTTKLEAPTIYSFPPLHFFLLTVWIVGVILAGAVLTSQHQPFRVADNVSPALFRPSTGGKWRAVHVLSGSCGCSQKIMAHLALRHPLRDFEEEVVVMDDGTPYLPESPLLLDALQRAKFPIRHIRPESLPIHSRLFGVPVLVVANPSNEIVYAGGYGSPEHDAELLQSLRAGRHQTSLPVFGCAVGRALQRVADPFRVKYPGVEAPQSLASASRVGSGEKETNDAGK